MLLLLLISGREVHISSHACSFCCIFSSFLQPCWLFCKNRSPDKAFLNTNILFASLAALCPSSPSFLLLRNQELSWLQSLPDNTGTNLNLPLGTLGQFWVESWDKGSYPASPQCFEQSSAQLCVEQQGHKRFGVQVRTGNACGCRFPQWGIRDKMF